MKILNLFFSVVFVLSAAVQYNDPDPYLWMPIYLFGAFLCYQATQQKYHKGLYLAALAVYIPYAIYLFIDSDGVISWVRDHQAESLVQSMKATKPWIEDAREFFGLLILVTALLMNMAWFDKQEKPKPEKKKAFA